MTEKDVEIQLDALGRRIEALETEIKDAAKWAAQATMTIDSIAAGLEMNLQGAEIKGEPS